LERWWLLTGTPVMNELLGGRTYSAENEETRIDENWTYR
jgi:hypothetical protein